MRKKLDTRGGTLRLIFLALMLLVFYGSYYLGNRHAREAPEPSALRAFDPPRPLPEFQLSDHLGTRFDEQALRGHWSVLFLGYTRSTTETPAMLGLAVRIYNRLAARPRLQREVRFVMLSADPEFDTPKRLVEYLGPYPATFVGVTGDREGIRQLAETWGGRFGDAADGALQHSTSLALIDPQGRAAGVFTGLVDPAMIATDIEILSDP